MERVVVLGYHLSEALLGLLSISRSGEIVGMVDRSYYELFFHADGDNRIALFEFFIPFVVGI